MPEELFIVISIRIGFSSPSRIATSSIAAAESEWIPTWPRSNGMRERPCSMSRASATSRLLPVNEGPDSATGLQQLRPLALGEVLDVGIKIVARNAGTLFRVVVFVVLPVQLLSTLVQL